MQTHGLTEILLERQRGEDGIRHDVHSPLLVREDIRPELLVEVDQPPQQHEDLEKHRRRFRTARQKPIRDREMLSEDRQDPVQDEGEVVLAVLVCTQDGYASSARTKETQFLDGLTSLEMKNLKAFPFFVAGASSSAPF
jgi:hypothetical protein